MILQLLEGTIFSGAKPYREEIDQTAPVKSSKIPEEYRKKRRNKRCDQEAMVIFQAPLIYPAMRLLLGGVMCFARGSNQEVDEIFVSTHVLFQSSCKVTGNYFFSRGFLCASNSCHKFHSFLVSM